MRSIRQLGLAVATVIVAVPLGLGAQAATDDAIFRNAWYWGAHGGQIAIPTSIARTTAPELGVDWMITRTRWAGQFFASQSFFNAVSTVEDVGTTAQRRVNIQDMRRVGFNALVFTPRLRWVRPYAGAGFSFNFVKAASLPQDASFPSAAERDAVLARIESAKSRVRLQGTAGFLVQYGRFAPYAQVSTMPTRGTGQWLVNGSGFTSSWQVGLRYTFGSAIERF